VIVPHSTAPPAGELSHSTGVNPCHSNGSAIPAIIDLNPGARRRYPWCPWSTLPRRVTALGFGREVAKVSRWLAGIAEGVPGGSVVIHAGCKRGASATGLRPEVVRRALAQLREAGLIHLVEPSPGHLANGWMLGDLGAARWVPRPGYTPRRMGADLSCGGPPTTESTTPPKGGVHNRVHNRVHVGGVSPLTGPLGTHAESASPTLNRPDGAAGQPGGLPSPGRVAAAARRVAEGVGVDGFAPGGGGERVSRAQTRALGALVGRNAGRATGSR
jgi:hypothetical protein